MTGRRGARLALVALSCAVLAAACGVPTDKKPRAIAADQPGQLSNTTTPTAPAGTGQSVTLYFTNEDGLVEVQRQVRPDPTLALAINQLLGGVTTIEKQRQLSTSIPADTSLRALRQRGQVLSLDLSSEFNSVQGEDFLRACAQIVYTVTDFSAVKSVRFLIDGKLQSVPTENDGNLEVVGRDNYPSLAPA